MAILESMMARKLTKPYMEKTAQKVREKVDETKENLKTKAEGMALKSGLIGKKYPQEYEDEQRRESRGMKKGGMVAASKMGKVKTSSKPDGVIKKGATKGKMVKMAAGGMPMVMKGGKKVPAFAADGKGKMTKGGMAMKRGGGKC